MIFGALRASALVLLVGATAFLLVNVRADEAKRAPILVPGVDEPAEMRVEPFPVPVLTDPERMLAQETNNLSNINDAKTILPALDRVLAKYPDFAVAYALRLVELCKGQDRAAVLANLDSAIKYTDASSPFAKSIGGLISMKAKVEYDLGRHDQAIADLEKALLADVDEGLSFANSGAVAPEKAASICTWSETDINSLVKRFQNDYRSYLFRGLYYGFFVTFQSGAESLLNRSFEAFDKSSALNPRSALPHFYKAKVRRNEGFFKQLSMSSAAKDKWNKQNLSDFARALKQDPNLLPALSGRAVILFNLKRYREATADYDRILQLDPTNYAAYNDRGLCKLNTGNSYGAIRDFTEAIKSRKRSLQDTNSQEARATAYEKTGQWELAIKDLTTAISLQVGGGVLLWRMEYFRAIYPEYKSISDEVLARKLHQTFHPNLKYEDFSAKLLDPNSDLRMKPSFVIQPLYIRRSADYLKLGNWRMAVLDHRRAVNGFPDFAEQVDRWQEVASTKQQKVFLDMQTYDDSHSGSVSLWIKLAGTKSNTLTQYEIRCASKQLRLLSGVKYNTAGNIVSQGEGGSWQAILPESVGESLFAHTCGVQ